MVLQVSLLVSYSYIIISQNFTTFPLPPGNTEKIMDVMVDKITQLLFPE
jgi:hypothetical protein